MRRRKNLHQDTDHLLELSEDGKDTWFGKKVRRNIRSSSHLRGKPGINLVARGDLEPHKKFQPGDTSRRARDGARGVVEEPMQL